MTANTDQKLKLHIEALERLISEKQGIQEDIKERYALAKAEGYDVPVIREVIKRRAANREELDKKEQLVAVYETQLGMDF